MHVLAPACSTCWGATGTQSSTLDFFLVDAMPAKGTKETIVDIEWRARPHLPVELVFHPVLYKATALTWVVLPALPAAAELDPLLLDPHPEACVEASRA